MITALETGNTRLDEKVAEYITPDSLPAFEVYAGKPHIIWSGPGSLEAALALQKKLVAEGKAEIPQFLSTLDVKYNINGKDLTLDESWKHFSEHPEDATAILEGTRAGSALYVNSNRNPEIYMAGTIEQMNAFSFLRMGEIEELEKNPHIQTVHHAYIDPADGKLVTKNSSKAGFLDEFHKKSIQSALNKLRAVASGNSQGVTEEEAILAVREQILYYANIINRPPFIMTHYTNQDDIQKAKVKDPTFQRSKAQVFALRKGIAEIEQQHGKDYKEKILEIEGKEYINGHSEEYRESLKYNLKSFFNNQIGSGKLWAFAYLAEQDGYGEITRNHDIWDNDEPPATRGLSLENLAEMPAESFAQMKKISALMERETTPSETVHTDTIKVKEKVVNRDLETMHQPETTLS